MAANPAFKTPAMERAAGISALKTVCDMAEGQQADKCVTLGYVGAIFGDCPFSWANIVTGFYAFLDKERSTSPASPVTSEGHNASPGEQEVAPALETDSAHNLRSNSNTQKTPPDFVRKSRQSGTKQRSVAPVN